MREIAYVVLAAGRARRMGFAKATAPLAGRSPLERLSAVLGSRDVTVVTNGSLATACALAMPSARVLVNDEPDLGMTASLLVADRAIAPETPFGVLLADKPFVRATTLERCEAACAAQPQFDLCVVTVANQIGHPVYFGPRARAILRTLPPGDTLRAIRDDPALGRIVVPCDDPGALVDLDTPEAWAAAEKNVRADA